MGIISYFCKHKGGKKMGQVRMLCALVGCLCRSDDFHLSLQV